MPVELDCGTAEEACWGEDLTVELGGWDVPLGGLATRGSSSDELSSDAPRMNFRRSLASGPELNIGTLDLQGFWVASGTHGTSVCGGSGSTVWTSGPAEAPSASGLLFSLCVEVAGAVDRECSSGWGECVADGSSSAAGRTPPDRDPSPFTSISTVLVLILHSSKNIHRINPKTANGSIQTSSCDCNCNSN